jgi:hypothetical protein
MEDISMPLSHALNMQGVAPSAATTLPFFGLQCAQQMSSLASPACLDRQERRSISCEMIGKVMW